MTNPAPQTAATQTTGFHLTEDQFELISRQVKDLCGINLHVGKKELVKARLGKRLRQLGLESFDDYLELVQSDATGAELTSMLDALCTNLTRFFREPAHFDYLTNHILPDCIHRNGHKPGRFRIWSAGCSSGEEAYSIAVTILEASMNLPKWDVGILASDLSTGALMKARKAVYAEDNLDDVSRSIRTRHFERVQREPETLFRIRKHVRDLIHFTRLNLMADWPMKGLFDAIFCRNVMIYFDANTKQQLIDRYWDMLAPGGTLLIGHSESLAGTPHRFQYIQPTIYQKPLER
jgi:chemotaxis protein methyltransferase CheR